MDSGTQFAKIIISIMILVAFFAATAYKLEMGQDAELEIGALIAAFAAVWGYWLGSSEGSARKTELLKGKEDA